MSENYIIANSTEHNYPNDFSENTNNDLISDNLHDRQITNDNRINSEPFDHKSSPSNQTELSELNKASIKENKIAQKQRSTTKQKSKRSDPEQISDNTSDETLNPQKLIPRIQYDFIPQYARNFLYHLINVELKSQKTVYEYYLDLRTFFRFIVQFKNITNEDNFDLIDASNCPASVLEKLTLTDLYEYLNYVREGRENNVRARMRKTSSLKSFYKYLCKQAIISENPTTYLEAPKQPKDLPIHLSVDDSIKLLESIDGPFKERNYAIITLFLNCGLRLSELVGINLSNINGNTLRVLGKGNKERILYLNQTCIDAIVDYLKVRPEVNNKDKNALFISKRGKRISRRMVQTLVENYIKQSGLDPEIYSTHKLRHTAATLMYQNGVDIRVLQQLLGHSNLGTTQIYTHLADKQVEDALNRNPLNTKKIKKKKTDEA